jgi:hypothetical protein
MYKHMGTFFPTNVLEVKLQMNESILRIINYQYSKLSKYFGVPKSLIYFPYQVRKFNHFSLMSYMSL